MRNLLRKIKMVFRYWISVFGFIFSDLFDYLKSHIVAGCIIFIAYFVFIAISGQAVDTLIKQGFISDLEAWARILWAVVPITLLYAFGLLLYYPAKKDDDKQKIIDKLSPDLPDLEFLFPDFPQVKGIQKLKIINNSHLEVTCHATLNLVAPLVFTKFIEYPNHYYSKNLVWSNKKSNDGNIKIDGNKGTAILDLVETYNDGFNFLFQNGNDIQVGYDNHPKENKLGENDYVFGLRLDGEFNGRHFIMEKSFTGNLKQKF